jgi:hypothetical protein
MQNLEIIIQSALFLLSLVPKKKKVIHKFICCYMDVFNVKDITWHLNHL